MPYDQSTFGTLLYGVKGVGYPIRYTNKYGGVGIFRGGGIKGLMPNNVIGKVLGNIFTTQINWHT